MGEKKDDREDGQEEIESVMKAMEGEGQEQGGDNHIPSLKAVVAGIRASYDKQIAAALAQIYDLRDARRAAVEKTEKRMIRKAMKECHWRTDRASEMLGVSAVTLWRKARQYEVKR